MSLVVTAGPRKRLSKYILARLEGDASGRAIDPETDPATLEHVLPENPSPDWDETFSEEQQAAYVYRLGNLTLLEGSLNRTIGNGRYDAKVDAYRVSKYELTRQLSAFAPSEWTPALIEERQRTLAARALALWRIDF